MQKPGSSPAVAAVTAAATAILFDLFHTLTAVEITNTPLPPQTWELLGLKREAWQAAWRAIEPARLKGEIADPYELLALPARTVDPAIDECRIRAAVRARLDKFANAVTYIQPEILETLAELRQRGKKLGLVSNADWIEVAAWPASPLRSAFDTVVFSCAVACSKPEPAIYLRACRDLAVLPRECLFVGDGGADELRGAKALGMATVRMTGILARLWPEQETFGSPYADCTIDDVRALVSGSL